MAAESLAAVIEQIDDQSLVYATPDGTLHYDSRIERMFPWAVLGVPLRRLLDTAADHAVDQPDGETDIDWHAVLKDLKETPK